MRLRNIPGAKEEILLSKYVIDEPQTNKGRWSALFLPDGQEPQSAAHPAKDFVQELQPEKNSGQELQPDAQHPLHIEIGMGKGRFLMDMARLHPEVNYVGIEMYDSVLLRALQKRAELEEKGLPINNCWFIREDARLLPEIFAPGEVGRIYLNFSDPWPKAKHAKRRLTSHQFLERYDQVLSPGGRVEFKTDNRDLFDFSLTEAKEAGWTILECTYDLHSTPAMMQGNIMTEYEEKFSSMGKSICKLTIVH